MKAVVLCVLVFAAFVAAQDKPIDAKAADKGEALKKRMAAVGVKDLDLKKLAGKWFNVAGSAAITKDFIKACTCNELNFKQIESNKLHVIALCRNVEAKKINSVNGTLTQVQPQQNKALFHLAFTEKQGDIKGVKVNQTEAAEVKKQVEGKKDEKPIAKAGDAEAKAKDLSVNTVVLKADDKFSHVIMGSPSLDSAWILARDRKFDDKLFNEYKQFLEQNGFTTTKLEKIDHSKCEGDLMKELIKGKTMDTPQPQKP